MTRANETELANLWMPFTANRQFKAAPRLLASAEGMWFTDIDSRKILDMTAGLWCVNAGHGRREITEAVERQLATLDYAPPFQMGHPAAFELAARLAAVAPQGLDRIFFTSSGSESVDTAMKIVLAYHRARGEGQRVRLGRAMLRADPRLVILDEPFRGLDREQRQELLREARRWWNDATLICITHDVADTRSFEPVVVIDDGTVVEQGHPQHLTATEQSRYHLLLDAEHAVRKGLWDWMFGKPWERR